MTSCTTALREQEDSPDLVRLRTRLARARTPLECYRVMIAAGNRAVPGLSLKLFDAYVSLAQQAYERAVRLQSMAR